jgi:hypothetical protein
MSENFHKLTSCPYCDSQSPLKYHFLTKVVMRLYNAKRATSFILAIHHRKRNLRNFIHLNMDTTKKLIIMVIRIYVVQIINIIFLGNLQIMEHC